MGYVYGLLLLFALTVGLRSRDLDAVKISLTTAAGSLCTWALMMANAHYWTHFNLTVLMIDSIMLAVFARVAFRSLKRWPMLVCAFQFMGMLIHIAGTLADMQSTRIIGVAQGLWAYFQCFAIIFGVMYHNRAISPEKNMTTGR
jgi:hypothetical protein